MSLLRSGWARHRFLLYLLLLIAEVRSASAGPQRADPFLLGKVVAQSAPGQGGERSNADLGSLRQLIDSGHAEEALQQIQTRAAARPVLRGLSRMKGLALYSQGKLTEADAAFAEALQEEPHDQESAQMRGLTLFRLGRPSAAIPLLEGAQTWNTESKVDPHYVLALCYLDTRRYDDARHAFATQYGFPPDSASAYLLAARMLLRREFLPVAKEFARKALELDPQIPLAHALLGEIALAGDHVEEAVAELERERLRNPLYGPVYDRLGDAYYRGGNYEQAQRSLQEALLLEPDATGPYILLGKVLLKRGDALGAATYLEHAKSMDPANYRTRSLLGQAYRAVGRKEDASREVQAAQNLQSASEPKLESGH